MFEQFFKKKKHLKEIVEERILQLQDILGDHVLLLFIRNHIKYLERNWTSFRRRKQ